MTPTAPQSLTPASNANNCWSRQGVLMNDLLNDLLNESVLRDGQIGYYCWTWWNVSVRATFQLPTNIATVG
jgi:hypothetical protein